jgi:outer membrane protein OmpU
MNKFKKIGLSALAGSLVAMSAQAEVTMTADASIALTKVNESAKTSYYQSDSIYFTYAGETDGGLNVTVSVEIDGDANGTNQGIDSRSIAIGTDSLGTITYAGHGGDSVMGGWDDVTPNAYEEVYAIVKNDAGTAATGAIGGQTGNDGVWRYDSPSYSGLQFHASYYAGTVTDASVSSYSDMGISFAPEMVEGLSAGYAQGSYDQAADVLGIDVSTMWVKYAYGPVTVGYQVSDSDGPSATHDDDTTAIGISYAVSENLSVSYGEHTIDNGAWSGVDQEASGFSASYTMGGTTIKAVKNSVDNIGGSAAADENGYEIALSFAF